MTFNYTVSFEHETLPVKTFKGQVNGSVGAASRRAIDAARKQVEGKLFYTSVVVVLEKAA